MKKAFHALLLVALSMPLSLAVALQDGGAAGVGNDQDPGSSGQSKQ